MLEPKLNHSQLSKINNYIKINKSEIILISWMNSLQSFDNCKLYITNLKYSLNNGIIILKLLDFIEN